MAAQRTDPPTAYAELERENEHLRYMLTQTQQAVAELSRAIDPLRRQHVWYCYLGETYYAMSARERLQAVEAQRHANELCAEAGYAAPGPRSVPLTMPQTVRPLARISGVPLSRPLGDSFKRTV